MTQRVIAGKPWLEGTTACSTQQRLNQIPITTGKLAYLNFLKNCVAREITTSIPRPRTQQTMCSNY
jgi:hypothetical protein